MTGVPACGRRASPGYASLPSLRDLALRVPDARKQFVVHIVVRLPRRRSNADRIGSGPGSVVEYRATEAAAISAPNLAIRSGGLVIIAVSLSSHTASRLSTMLQNVTTGTPRHSSAPLARAILNPFANASSQAAWRSC